MLQSPVHRHAAIAKIATPRERFVAFGEICHSVLSGLTARSLLLPASFLLGVSLFSLFHLIFLFFRFRELA